MLDPVLVQTLEGLFLDQADNIERAVRCLKVLAHPQRMKILCVLQEGEQTVQQLEQYVGIAQATLSQHLSLLKDRGILSSRRQGNFSFYQVANPAMVELFEKIQMIFCKIPAAPLKGGVTEFRSTQQPSAGKYLAKNMDRSL